MIKGTARLDAHFSNSKDLLAWLNLERSDLSAMWGEGVREKTIVLSWMNIILAERSPCLPKGDSGSRERQLYLLRSKIANKIKDTHGFFQIF